MSYVLVRLGDHAVLRGTEATRFLLHNFRCRGDREAEYFLHLRALPAETANESRTYLALDTDKDRALGFFTVTAEGDARRPAYAIAYLAQADDAPADLERRLIRSATELFSRLADVSGRCPVSAACAERLIGSYENAGFVRAGREQNGRYRMALAFRSLA